MVCVADPVGSSEESKGRRKPSKRVLRRLSMSPPEETIAPGG